MDKEIYIFGCTALGWDIAKKIRQFTDNGLIFFLDNSDEMSGKKYHDYFVKKPEMISNHSNVILASFGHYKDMKCQLLELGFDLDNIVIPSEIYLNEKKVLEGIIRKRTPKENLELVFDLTEHCNLNCKRCDHFSPLSDPIFMDYGDYKRDLLRIKELVGDKISSISLEGGEPLLNESIGDFIDITREIYPNVRLEIISNGLLLKNMAKVFFKTCREQNVIISVTKYPIGVDYKEIEDRAIQEGVKFRYFDGGDEEKKSMHKPIDLNGCQNKYESFHQCYMANSNCVDLKKGRLYPCTFAANVSLFNRFFCKNIPVTDNDYYDIYSEGASFEQIVDFLCNPIDLCRYCKVNDWTFNNMWGISEKRIDEWT